MNIIDAGQSISLEGPDAGKVKCWFVVRAQNGNELAVMTNEETINQLLSFMTGVELPYTNSQDAIQLNGDYFSNHNPEAHSISIGTLSREAVQEEEPLLGLGQSSAATPPQRPRHVSTDEYGYPIVQRDDSSSQEVVAVEEEEDPGEQI